MTEKLDVGSLREDILTVLGNHGLEPDSFVVTIVLPDAVTRTNQPDHSLFIGFSNTIEDADFQWSISIHQSRERSVLDMSALGFDDPTSSSKLAPSS